MIEITMMRANGYERNFLSGRMDAEECKKKYIELIELGATKKRDKGVTLERISLVNPDTLETLHSVSY